MARPPSRILTQLDDEALRRQLTGRYAEALLTAGAKAKGFQLLKKMVEGSWQIPDARKRIEMLSRIAEIQAQWNDTTQQLQTDRLLLKEMQAHPLEWSPGIFPVLINRLTRLNRREEAKTALNLLKQYVDRQEMQKKNVYLFRGEIAFFAREIEEMRNPPAEYDRPVVLRAALLIKNEKTRAQELGSCVFQRLQNHQLKKALQVLPLFPMAEDQRKRVKQALRLK